MKKICIQHVAFASLILLHAIALMIAPREGWLFVMVLIAYWIYWAISVWILAGLRYVFFLDFPIITGLLFWCGFFFLMVTAPVMLGLAVLALALFTLICAALYGTVDEYKILRARRQIRRHEQV